MNSVKFKPHGPRVLVSRTEIINKTASGIIMPGNNLEGVVVSKIVAISASVETISLGVDVMYFPNNGVDITLDGIRYKILNVTDILGAVL